ncbi:AAEL007012-PA [Aedes aegypti]|uniref:AAEL007012-PA n=1 Tax=Aedes aegypti TaxID=7159 RepID=Q173U0_AEDAE|nr:AAEL007012-PA [Aedes aegypti]
MEKVEPMAGARRITEGIRVTVFPFYMGCRDTSAASVYWVGTNNIIELCESF